MEGALTPNNRARQWSNKKSGREERERGEDTPVARQEGENLGLSVVKEKEILPQYQWLSPSPGAVA